MCYGPSFLHLPVFSVATTATAAPLILVSTLPPTAGPSHHIGASPTVPSHSDVTSQESKEEHEGKLEEEAHGAADSTPSFS